MHYHPQRWAVPGGQDIRVDRSALEPVRIRGMEYKGQGGGQDGSGEGRRGNDAVQSDCQADEKDGGVRMNVWGCIAVFIGAFLGTAISHKFFYQTGIKELKERVYLLEERIAIMTEQEAEE